MPMTRQPTKAATIASTTRRFGMGAGSIYTIHGQRKYLDDHERNAFLIAVENLPPDERMFCLTLFWTGCRISEALALNPYQVAWHEQMVVFRTLKQRGAVVHRHVPVPAMFMNELCAIVDKLEDRFWPWTRKQGWRIVKNVMREANIEGPQATARGLRHAFGVHAIRSGVPLNKIQKWMGHSDISITAIYTDVVGVEEIELAALMWS